MVKFIIGDYLPKKTDLVLDNFVPGMIFKTKTEDIRHYVIFAEFVGLSKDDCMAIAKNATRDVIVVLQSNKLISGLRQSKNVKIEYNSGNSASVSIFEVSNALIKIEDREYVHEFLKTNKPQIYMLVKALIGGSSVLTKHNKEVVAWLDMYQWKVSPEILYAVMAYKIKAQPNVYRLPWKFPKKSKTDQ